MPIRVVCPFCKSKIDANDKLLGQVRKCPKCGNEIEIKPAEVQSVAVPQAVPVPSSVDVNNMPGVQLNSQYIWRFKPNNLYVILGHDRIIAWWKFAEGWQLNVGNGYASAKRNASLIPEHGNYTFVEGIVQQTDKGKRLVGIRFFELSGRGILIPLGRSETEILEKVTRRSILGSTQKRFFLQFIRQHYFNDFTEDAPEIIEFLTGQDAHSREIGQVEERETSPLQNG